MEFKRAAVGTMPTLPHDYSVQFGAEKRDYNQKAYPFYYGFVRYPYQIGTANPGTGTYSVVDPNEAEGPDGILIMPGQTLNLPIRMDNDANFHLLYTKYSAWRDVIGYTSTVLFFETGVTALILTDVGMPPTSYTATFGQADVVDDDEVIFTRIPEGVTGIVVNTVYHVVSAGMTEFSVSATEGGMAIEIDVTLAAGALSPTVSLLFPPLTGYFSPTSPESMVNGQSITFTSIPTGVTGITIGTQYLITNSDSLGFEVADTAGNLITVSVTDAAAISGTLTVVFNLLPGNGSREYLIYPYNPFISPALTPPQDASQTLLPMYPETLGGRIPYWTELDVSMYMTSSESRDNYGGLQRNPISGAIIEEPLPILDLQGSQDGLGMLKTPWQLPADGSLLIKIRSNSIYPLRVYGHLFGYKITV